MLCHAHETLGPPRGSRAPDDHPSHVFARLIAQPDEALVEAVAAATCRLCAPGLGGDELVRLLMERVFAQALLRDRQGQRPAVRDAAGA